LYLKTRRKPFFAFLRPYPANRAATTVTTATTTKEHEKFRDDDHGDHPYDV